MRLEQLEYLLEVAAAGSIAKASKKLHITGQNISYALKALEEELGVKLFERSPAGLHLTAEGNDVSKIAQSIINQAYQLQNYYQPSKQTIDHSLKEELKCLATPSFIRFLVGFIKRLTPYYPNLIFHIIEIDAQSIWQKLEREPQKYHFAFTDLIGEIPADSVIHRHYKLTLLKKSPLVLLSGNGHPINQLSKHSLSLVEKYPTIFFTNEEATNRTCYDYLVRQNYHPNIYFFTNSTAAFYNAISNGQALGLSTEYISKINISNRSGSLNMLSLREKIFVSHLLVTSQHLSPGEQLLLNVVHEAFSPYGGLPNNDQLDT